MSDAAQPFVSVVIPHYNDRPNLQRCLDGLRRQTWPRERYEIIVADNNSEGGVAAVERMAPDVTVVPAPVQGAGPARNAAVAVARGAVLAFIDSDCFAEPDWIAEGVAALRQFDYVGGQVITVVSDEGHPTAAEAYEATFAFNFKKYIERDKFSGSGNLFVPKPVFERVGGFRAGVSEDVDWCRRANALGYRLGYAERAVVRHAARREWSELTRKWDRMIQEALLLARERRAWQLRWLLHALLVGGSPWLHWLRVVKTPRLSGARARSRGVLGLFMIRGYRCCRMLRLLLGRSG